MVYEIKRCFFVSTLLVFLTSCSMPLLITPDALKWQALNSGSNASFRGLSVVNEKLIWVSGSQNTILKSMDGGESWQRLNAPGIADSDFRDIEAFDQNNVIAMSVGNGEASKIFKTIDGGETWSIKHTNQYPQGFYDGMSFWNKRKGILVGDPVNNRFLVLLTEDGGETWLEVGKDSLPLAQLGEHAFAASGTGITVQENGLAWFVTGGSVSRVFKTEDYGKTWTVSATPIIQGRDSAGIFSIAFYNAATGIVVGGDYKMPESITKNVAVTRNGGVSWQLSKVLPTGFQSAVIYLNKDTLLAVGSHGSAYSIDAGVSWSTLGATGYHAIDNAENTVYAVGAEGRIGKLRMELLEN